MATEKTFTVAGTATNADGTVKVRFANDLVARIKILNKNNCTNINLVELPKAMTKMEALQHLQTLGITAGDAGFAVALGQSFCTFPVVGGGAEPAQCCGSVPVAFAATEA